MGKFKDFSFEQERRRGRKRTKGGEKKERMTYWLDPRVIDKVLAYAHWTPGATISSTVEEALRLFFQGKRVKGLPPELRKKREEARARKRG